MPLLLLLLPLIQVIGLVSDCEAQGEAPVQSDLFVAEELKVLGQDFVTKFTVKIGSCTGTLISSRWVLTAAHCFNNVLESHDGPANKFGDTEYTFVEGDDVFVRVGEHRIRVARVILNGNFQGEALSWKGFDLALAWLEEEAPITSNICFETGDDFDDLNSRNTFMAGYGRIYIPHCITDGQGPEAFGVCSRPADCVRDHRTRECGISFEYEGREHNECIRSATPSAKDPECQALKTQYPDIEAEADVAHIFDEGGKKYITTCFYQDPSSSNATTNGWCVTRSPGVDQAGEVSGNKGWGFCLSDESQKYCNDVVPENKYTLKAMKVAVLNDVYCRDKLGDNLRAEQPGTSPNEYENLLDGAGVMCVGRNITRDLSHDRFFRKMDNSESGQPLYQRAEHSRVIFNRYLIDGGPACFGDSGGPLFKVIRFDNETQPKPVLIGVFSFLLWGTCRGSSEPSYYLRVKHFRPWLDSYLSSEMLVACRS